MSRAIITLEEFGMLISDLLRSDRDVNVGVGGMTGVGKANVKGTKVLMANGEWNTVENIKNGDEVLSPQEDGSHLFAKVSNTYSIFSNENYAVYERNRQKKLLYECCGSHKIPMYYRCVPKENGKHQSKKAYWKLRNFEARELHKLSNKPRNRIAFSSFAIQEFKGRNNSIIEPYTLGFYLSEGSFITAKSSNLTITTSHKPSIEYISQHYECMSKQGKKKSPESFSYRFSLLGNLATQLRRAGLENKKSGNKFIPKEAMLSDLNYRKQLLAGLIDGGGYYSHGGYSITSKSEQLAKDILDLVYSLGGRGRIWKVRKQIKSIGFEGEYFQVSFYIHELELPILKIWKTRNNSCIYLASNRLAINVEKSKPSQVYGFQLDSPSGLFITNHWMVTHNSCFGSKLQKAYSKVSGVPWDFSCMTWSRKELMEWIDGKPKSAKGEDGLRENQKPEFSAILPDELFLMFYRRNWYQDGQIDSIGTFNMCRDRHLFLCGNVPNFWDLDGAFTSRLRFYVYIPQRGVAWLFEQENNPFASDPWNPGENKKIFRKHKKPDKIANFVGEIYFPDWTTEEKDEYYKIRNEKRIKAVSDDRDTRTERYGRVKGQRDKLIRVIRNQMPSITNEDLAEMLDISKRMVEIILGTEPKE